MVEKKGNYSDRENFGRRAGSRTQSHQKKRGGKRERG